MATRWCQRCSSHPRCAKTGLIEDTHTWQPGECPTFLPCPQLDDLTLIPPQWWNRIMKQIISPLFTDICHENCSLYKTRWHTSSLMRWNSPVIARGSGRSKREHDPTERQQRSVCCGWMKGTHLISPLQVCFVFSTGDKRSGRRNPTRAFFVHGNRVHETAMWLKSPARPVRRARTCGIVPRIVTKTIARVNISLSKHLPLLCLAIAATITPIHPSVCHSLANNTRRWLHTLPPAPLDLCLPSTFN